MVVLTLQGHRLPIARDRLQGPCLPACGRRLTCLAGGGALIGQASASCLRSLLLLLPCSSFLLSCKVPIGGVGRIVEAAPALAALPFSKGAGRLVRVVAPEVDVAAVPSFAAFVVEEAVDPSHLGATVDLPLPMGSALS